MKAAARRPGFFTRAAAAFALTLVFARAAAGAVTAFEARADATEATVGETITFEIKIETDDAPPRVKPSEPDFGGLRPGPSPQAMQGTQSVNGVVRHSLSMRYLLIANAPGAYTIGPSQITVEGRTYSTKPVTIKVSAAPTNELPASLRDRPIIHPQTSDARLNEQLRGSIFVLPVASDAKPYVGEPVLVSFFFYLDERLAKQNVGPQQLQLSIPDFKNALAELVYQPTQSLEYKPTEVDGRVYYVAALYQTILTPTQAGRLTIDGFSTRFGLPLRSSSRRQSVFDEFFNEPFFGGGVETLAAAAPLDLEVRPLPAEGRPANFSGTVGSFELDSKIDLAAMTEDDLVTLSVSLEGEGNASLAAIPEFAENDDFEIYESPKETDEWTEKAALKSRKNMEFILRPKRAGALTIPPIEYSLFDPRAERYRVLRTMTWPVNVAPGKQGGSAAAPDSEGAAPGAVAQTRLRYLKPVHSISTSFPAPLAENPIYWGAQLLALAIAGWAFMSARRRERIDPAQVRRSGSWSRFERKLRTVGRASGPNAEGEGALALERAIRELVADRNNLSADGLTGEEIAARLAEAGLAEDRARRVREIVELCALARYAPMAAGGARTADLAREARQLLAEALR